MVCHFLFLEYVYFKAIHYKKPSSHLILHFQIIFFKPYQIQYKLITCYYNDYMRNSARVWLILNSPIDFNRVKITDLGFGKMLGSAWITLL